MSLKKWIKNQAIVLSCFGSVVEKERYLALKKYIQSEFSGSDVFLSFSSGIIREKLSQNGFEIKNLLQTLSDISGYKKIVVASVNLFPQGEHELALSIVDKFPHPAVSFTDALFAGKEGADLLRGFGRIVRKERKANLYVFHGSKTKEASLDTPKRLLKELDALNFLCSIKGADSFEVLKESLKKEFLKNKVEEIELIPMLLVSGNHYRNEITAIKETLAEDFDVLIAKGGSGGKFALLELKIVKEAIKNRIEAKMN